MVRWQEASQAPSKRPRGLIKKDERIGIIGMRCEREEKVRRKRKEKKRKGKEVKSRKSLEERKKERNDVASRNLDVGERKGR